MLTRDEIITINTPILNRWRTKQYLAENIIEDVSTTNPYLVWIAKAHKGCIPRHELIRVLRQSGHFNDYDIGWELLEQIYDINSKFKPYCMLGN